MLIVIVVLRKFEELNSLFINLIIINIDVLLVNFLLSIKSYYFIVRNVFLFYKMQFIFFFIELCFDKYYRFVVLCYVYIWQLYFLFKVVYFCLNFIIDWFLCFRYGFYFFLLRFCSQIYYLFGIRGGNYFIIFRRIYVIIINRGDIFIYGLEIKIIGQYIWIRYFLYVRYNYYYNDQGMFLQIFYMYFEGYIFLDG